MFQLTDPTYKTSLLSILAETKLLSMATVKPDSSPWINTAYFAHTDSLIFYLLTPFSSVHGQNLARNPKVAFTIFNSQQNHPKKRGLQFTGTCTKTAPAETDLATRTWWDRVVGKEVDDSLEIYHVGKGYNSRMYTLIPDWVRIFDEAAFGYDTWVQSSITR